MESQIEQVLLLCPEADPKEVENDLNFTRDVETTLNNALDGKVSLLFYVLVFKSK